MITLLIALTAIAGPFGSWDLQETKNPMTDEVTHMGMLLGSDGLTVIASCQVGSPKIMGGIITSRVIDSDYEGRSRVSAVGYRGTGGAKTVRMTVTDGMLMALDMSGNFLAAIHDDPSDGALVSIPTYGRGTVVHTVDTRQTAELLDTMLSLCSGQPVPTPQVEPPSPSPTQLLPGQTICPDPSAHNKGGQ
jgi:hypothetical protein